MRSMVRTVFAVFVAALALGVVASASASAFTGFKSEEPESGFAAKSTTEQTFKIKNGAQTLTWVCNKAKVAENGQSYVGEKESSKAGEVETKHVAINMRGESLIAFVEYEECTMSGLAVAVSMNNCRFEIGDVVGESAQVDIVSTVGKECGITIKKRKACTITIGVTGNEGIKELKLKNIDEVAESLESTLAASVYAITANVAGSGCAIKEGVYKTVELDNQLAVTGVIGV